MSSTLRISKGTSWMPRVWVFEEVLERLADVVERRDETLANRLREPIGHFPFMDFSSLKSDQYLALLDDLDTAYEEAVNAGHATFTDRSNYFELMHDFSQLRLLAYTDARAETQSAKFMQGEVTIRKDTQWRAPGLIYDFILEFIAIDVKNEDLSTQLRLGRTRGRGYCDLSSVKEADFCQLIKAATWLNRFYEAGIGKISIAPTIFFDLAAYIQDFFQQLRSDMRSHDCQMDE